MWALMASSDTSYWGLYPYSYTRYVRVASAREFFREKYLWRPCNSARPRPLSFQRGSGASGQSLHPLDDRFSCLWILRRAATEVCLLKNRYPLLQTNSFFRPTNRHGTPRPFRAGRGTSLSRTTSPRLTDASLPSYEKGTCSPRARCALCPSNISPLSKALSTAASSLSRTLLQ